MPSYRSKFNFLRSPVLVMINCETRTHLLFRLSRARHSAAHCASFPIRCCCWSFCAGSLPIISSAASIMERTRWWLDRLLLEVVGRWNASGATGIAAAAEFWWSDQLIAALRGAVLFSLWSIVMVNGFQVRSTGSFCFTKLLWCGYVFVSCYSIIIDFIYTSFSDDRKCTIASSLLSSLEKKKEKMILFSSL